jgi:hypothetical protein
LAEPFQSLCTGPSSQTSPSGYSSRPLQRAHDLHVDQVRVPTNHVNRVVHGGRGVVVASIVRLQPSASRDCVVVLPARCIRTW